MTGDIGQWNPNGTLSIIDRKKVCLLLHLFVWPYLIDIECLQNLVKLSGGEYVALERLEATYKACPIVSNIMVHADTQAKQPMAVSSADVMTTMPSSYLAQVIFPHEGNLKRMAGQNADLEHLCSDPKVKRMALQELISTGKKSGFKQLEVCWTYNCSKRIS